MIKPTIRVNKIPPRTPAMIVPNCNAELNVVVTRSFTKLIILYHERNSYLDMQLQDNQHDTHMFHYLCRHQCLMIGIFDRKIDL
jgi:hypothetical protein